MTVENTLDRSEIPVTIFSLAFPSFKSDFPVNSYSIFETVGTWQ